MNDLIQKRLHGLATGEDLKELDALLASSTEAADAFAARIPARSCAAAPLSGGAGVSTIQAQVRRVRQRRLLAFAAAALVVAAAGFFFTRSGPVLAMHGDVALHAGDLLKGPATITFPGEVTVFKLGNWSALTFEASDPGKRFYLSQGRLTASVDRQAIRS